MELARYLAIAVVLGRAHSSPIDNATGPLAPRTAELACTTTLSHTYSANPCTTWNGTSTKYPSTVTSYTSINCNGCDSVSVADQFWYCGVQTILATETVKTARTTWSTVCSATPTAAVVSRAAIPSDLPTVPLHVGPPRPVSKTILTSVVPTPRRRQAVATSVAPVCTTITRVNPLQTAGPTSIVYQHTTTTTSKLPCGGCSLLVSTNLIAGGQPNRFTYTTTASSTLTTAYACE